MKKIIIALLLVFNLTVVMALPATVFAQNSNKDAVCEGVGLTGNGGNGCDSGSSSGSVNSTIKIIINLFSFVVGVVAVIMIIIGGFKYVTSTGDSAKISSAKDTILYAVIGLVVVALSQVIVRFVLTKIT
jgi:hypothetical protein